MRKEVIVIVLLLSMGLAAAAQELVGQPMTKKTDDPILSAPLTHTDWRLVRGTAGQGEASVRYMLDRCKAVGLKKIYWRCFNAGQAMYNSTLAKSVASGWDEPDNYNAGMRPGQLDWSFVEEYASYDSLQVAVDYGHKIGLEVHAWLSINEDDHGWGLISRFSREHAQYRWVKRSGMPYNSQLSFAFPEVRAYKLGLVKEILGYDVDGFFFDWIRTGDIRNGPQTTEDGTADYGYETILVEGFKSKCGHDPRELPNNDENWVRYRAEPQTIFMREAHDLIKGKSKDLEIAAMVYQPWAYRGDGTKWINGALYGGLTDVATWAQEGLVDHVVAAGYFIEGGTAEKAYAYLKDLTQEKCDVWLYCWVPKTMDEFELSLQKARELGAKEILYWEADYIDGPDRKDFSDGAMLRQADGAQGGD